MDWCVVRYAGASSSYPYNTRAILWSNTSVRITNSEFSYGSRNGLDVYNPSGGGSRYTLRADNLSIKENNGVGLSFTRNYSDIAVVVQPPDGYLDLTCTNNGSYAVQIMSSMAVEMVGPGHAEFSGNGSNAIEWDGGTLATSLHWYDLGVSYLLPYNTTINAGSTFTLDPGVCIKFNSTAYSQLVINASFSAVGTAQKPIAFTSWDDNSVGGVTGSGSPQKGSWRYIDIHPGSSTSARTAVMDWCVVKYAGYNSGNPYNVRAILWSNTSVAITNSEFSYGGRGGLTVHNPSGGGSRYTLQADNLSIKENNGVGLSFTRNYSDIAVVVQPPDGYLDLTCTNNGSYAVQIMSSMAVEMVGPGHAEFSGNGSNAVEWDGGTLATSLHWYDLGVSYLLPYNTTINAGSTFTLDPGVCIKFNSTNKPQLKINASFSAVGTAEKPITFTSWDDNSVGGATGTGSPVRGGWRYLSIHPGTSASARTAVLDWCVMKYGGYDSSNPFMCQLSLWDNNTISIINSEFSYSARRGLDLFNRQQNSRFELDRIRFLNSGGSGLSAGSSSSTSVFSLRVRNCSFQGNGSGGAQIAWTGTAPALVDASLCYWGGDDVDTLPAQAPDGWRITPWYTADPFSSDALNVSSWSGNFNPAPDSQIYGYKNQLKLGLSAPTSRAWHTRVFGPDSPSILAFEDTSQGASYSIEWGAGSQPGKYVVEISDDAQPAGFPAIHADVWADPSLYGVLTDPVANRFYGVLTGYDLSLNGILYVSPSCVSGSQYTTSLQILPQTGNFPVAFTKSYSAQCFGTKDNPVALVSPTPPVSNGTYYASWIGNVTGKPARWMEITKPFNMADIACTVTPNVASGAPSSSDQVQVIVDATNLPGTIQLLEAKIVRRRYLHDGSLNPCVYCPGEYRNWPAGVSFNQSDSDTAVLSNPTNDGGLYTYTWPTQNHGDGLYAARLHVVANLGGAQADVTFWDHFRYRELAGEVLPKLDFTLIDPDQCGSFKYDGKHLLEYTFPAGWYSLFQGANAPVIAGIYGGIVTPSNWLALRAYDKAVMPLDGIGTDEHHWYWDGVLYGRHYASSYPVDASGDGGLLMAELVQAETTAAYSCVNTYCTRQSMRTTSDEFVLQNFGDVIDPILAVCPTDSSGPNKFQVTVTVNRSCLLSIRLWRTGALEDTTIPTAPSLVMPAIQVEAGQFTWGDPGLINGKRLLEGLYEVEAIATVQDAEGRNVSQTAYQVLPIRW